MLIKDSPYNVSALSSLSAGKHPTPPLSIRLRHTSFFLIWEGGRHIATFKSALCSESSPSTEIHDLSQLLQVFISITFSVKSSLSTLWKCAFLPSVLHTSLLFYFSLSFSHHLAYFIYLIYSFFFFHTENLSSSRAEVFTYAIICKYLSLAKCLAYCILPMIISWMSSWIMKDSQQSSVFFISKIIPISLSRKKFPPAFRKNQNLFLEFLKLSPYCLWIPDF